MTDEEWAERLAGMVAETLRRQAAKKAMREQRARQRAWGLKRRHAEKLDRRPPDKP